MSHGLNKVTLTISNAAAFASGWTLSAAGQLTTTGMTGYVASTTSAVVQPKGSRRMVELAGSQQLARYKVWIYKSAAGTWPTIRGGPDLSAQYLPTLFQIGGLYYEVQLVRDWTSGLLPHIYAEAELLSLNRPATENTVDPGDSSNTVEW